MIKEPAVNIELCIVDAQGARCRALEVDTGASVESALAAAGIALEPSTGLAVFGRRARLTDALAEGDRLEVCAPIMADPKTARREAAARQGDIRYVTSGRHGGKHRLAAKL